MIDNYKRLFSKRRIVPNLLMLEIVEKLYNKLPSEVPYGMTELYDILSHPKPTFSSFRSQISVLVSAECLIIYPSKEKASKKSVILTDTLCSELERDIYG